MTTEREREVAQVKRLCDAFIHHGPLGTCWPMVKDVADTIQSLHESEDERDQLIAKLDADTFAEAVENLSGLRTMLFEATKERDALRSRLGRSQQLQDELAQALKYWLPDETMRPDEHAEAWHEAVSVLQQSSESLAGTGYFTARVVEEHKPTCAWTEDENGPWQGCGGKYFNFNEGGPVENGFKFCPYCGKPIYEHAFDYEESAVQEHGAHSYEMKPSEEAALDRAHRRSARVVERRGQTDEKGRPMTYWGGLADGDGKP